MRLNDEQRKIFEENERLIGKFISDKNLRGEDWYSIIAEALILAIIKHDPSRGKLSTIFYLIADREMKREFERIKKRSKITTMKSDCLSNQDYLGIGVEDFILSEFTSDLNEEQRRVVELINQGYLKKDIAVIMGVSRVKVSRIIKSMEDKLLNGR